MRGRPNMGMPCVNCSGDTRTIDSRPFEGSVRRRRECRACGLRFTTLETPLADARAKTLDQIVDKAVNELRSTVKDISREASEVLRSAQDEVRGRKVASRTKIARERTEKRTKTIVAQGVVSRIKLPSAPASNPNTILPDQRVEEDRAKMIRDFRNRGQEMAPDDDDWFG